MTRAIRRLAPATALMLASLSVTRVALADGHRVAAVDPDAQLARALDIALSPWGATVTRVSLDPTGATTTSLPVDRARAVASETHADVVMWVSSNEGHFAVWIYDVASDHASLRDLSTGPPFNATTAAAVALSVKALLRFTVVAPPPERFGAPPEEPRWPFGVRSSLAEHFAGSGLLAVEPRIAIDASFWPALLHNRWGVLLTVSTGTGVHIKSPVPNGDLSAAIFDTGIRGAAGTRLRVTQGCDLELSLGATLHVLIVDYSISNTARNGLQIHYGLGLEPQVAFDVALLGGSFRLAPWLGGTLPLLALQVAVNGGFEVESGAAAEGGIRAEFVLP